MPPDLAANVAHETTKIAFDLPPQYLALGVVLLGLSVLVSLGAGISSIWANLRPRPSAADSLKDFAKEVAETYATKEALAKFEERIAADAEAAREDRATELNILRTDMTTLRGMMTQGFGDIQRSLGRLEGKVSK